MIYLITHTYKNFITTTEVCIQSNIFHQSFSLRVNKFIIQYFRSLLYFVGPLSESKFLIVFNFSFPEIYQWIYCSIQTFKPVNYSLMPHGSHLKILGSQVPLVRYLVPPRYPGFQVPGVGSHFSGMPFFPNKMHY